MSKEECWLRNVRKEKQRRIWNPHERERESSEEESEEEDVLSPLFFSLASALCWRQWIMGLRLSFYSVSSFELSLCN